MQLSNKEQKLLLEYKNWLKENNLSNKCNVYFSEQNSILVFQVWNLEQQISESVWLKVDNEKWKYYIKTLGEKSHTSFSFSKILAIEKKFVLKQSELVII
ncbi:hypothetical protein [Spiroplasma endosymbiont of Polydrusus pterygomalis]|uniref:hypothetical protein n=1 Tax=Spiroplasma endosymbiont of Polydrusus pterygomalis TaxID=3139327 RepID=UPI003CCAB67A